MKVRTISGLVLSAAVLFASLIPSLAPANTASGHLSVSANIAAACVVTSQAEPLDGSDLADPSVTATCTQGTNLVITYARIGSTGTPSAHAAAQAQNSVACSGSSCGRPVRGEGGAVIVAQLDVVVANLTF